MELGTNILAGNRPKGIMAAYGKLQESIASERRECRVPLWDGRAAERIWEVLLPDS
jgi:UDP-N-acetylglucosamine 2-epimerase